MKHKSFISLLFLWLAIAVGAQPKHEIRAVWLTTIGGIDWPSTPASDSKSIQSQQQELCQILDKLKAINVNTILFHTRVRATTSYPSDIEPWYESYSGYPGVSPGYDVLQYGIDEGHRRGMEVHAWVVTLPIGKWNSIGCRELRKRYPKIVRRIGEDGFMNPEQPQTAEYLSGRNNTDVLCVWSLGSLLNGDRSNIKRLSGYLLHVTIRRDGKGGAEIRNPQFTPVYTWKYKQDGRIYYRCVDAGGEIPDGMDSEQQKNMSKAAETVRSVLKESPLTER